MYLTTSEADAMEPGTELAEILKLTALHHRGETTWHGYRTSGCPGLTTGKVGVEGKGAC